jgi:hypothetical protein
VSISDRDRKILWARAGGWCSICGKRLVTEGTEAGDRPCVIGQEAHIISEQPTGPRHEYLPDYDVYDNFILLCGDDHKPADEQVRHYTVGELRRIKADHEAWVDSLGSPSRPFRLAPDPAYPIPQYKLIISGNTLWDVASGSTSRQPHWDNRMNDEQRDLIASFLDNLGDWIDAESFTDTYTAGRDAAKDLNDRVLALAGAGVIILARKRHCLLTGGPAEPDRWRVLDLVFRLPDLLEALFETAKEAGFVPESAADGDQAEEAGMA